MDNAEKEALTIRFDGFDCTTFVELILAESRSPFDVNGHVINTRYRNGILMDYASRIHYFTEWIYQSDALQIVRDITPEIPCSRPYKFNINFMSQHRAKYKQLQNDEQFDKIVEMEKSINHYTWKFIPKEKVKECSKYIHDGDIIAITTNIVGLDISHLGFAFYKKGKLHLLHASSDAKKVVISSQSLSAYLVSNKKQTGIMVLRPL